MTRPSKKNHYAIVDSSGRIVSIHKTRTAADDAGWGHDRELVQLTSAHDVGDEIEYSDKGIETN